MKLGIKKLVVISILVLGSLIIIPVLSLEFTNNNKSMENSSYLHSKTIKPFKQLESTFDVFQGEFSVNEAEIPFSGFLSNLGQVQNKDVKFYYSQNDISIGFESSRILYKNHAIEETAILSFENVFVDSNTVTPAGRHQLSNSANFFFSDIQVLNTPAWKEIWYTNIYSGVDLRFFMTNQGLQYDFYIHPVADLTHLHEAFPESNNDQISVLKQRKASISQIDLTLSFSTFLGGNNQEWADDIKVDNEGNSYIIGTTRSTDFPVLESFNDTHSSPGKFDVFITKLDPTGNLVFSTFIGGDDYEFGYGLDLDEIGNIYITGHTYSSNFPLTPNAYDITHDAQSDVFVTKLNATGNGLIFSTLIGGGSWEFTRDIIVDANKDIYLIGETRSEDYPTLNAYNDTHGSQGEINPSYDIFITKLNSTGTGLVFSTFIGGYDNDRGNSFDLDSEGNIYFTGNSESSNFPTKNAYNATFGGVSDAILGKLNATGNGLIFSTFFGGDNEDDGLDITLDVNKKIYISGNTNSPNFPIDKAYNSTYGGGFDVYVIKFNSTGNGIVFSTFLGGSANDYGKALVLDDNNNILLAGYTGSPSFPTLNAYNDTFGGNNEIFLTKLNSTGNGLIFSTFFGGDDDDYAYAMDMNPTGNICITGQTSSTNFPVLNAYNSTYGTNADSFVVKFSPIILDSTPPTITLVSPMNNTIHPSGTTINLSITDDHLETVLYNWDNTTNKTISTPYNVTLPAESGTHVLRVYAKDTAGHWTSEIFVFTTKAKSQGLDLIIVAGGATIASVVIVGGIYYRFIRKPKLKSKE